VLGKNPDSILVMIDEVAAENWGTGSETISTRRRRAHQREEAN
jgi:4-oxalocrotonate tautomerase family enzyme